MRKKANHMVRGGSRRGPIPQASALLTILFADCFAPGVLQAQTLMLGDLETRSFLGEPFAARVPVQFPPEGDFGLQCIRILPHPLAAQGTPLPSRLSADIETVADKKWLALRSPSIATSPVAGIRIEIACNNSVAKDYIVLLDPAPGDVARVPASPASAAPQTAPIAATARITGSAVHSRSGRAAIQVVDPGHNDKAEQNPQQSSDHQQTTTKRTTRVAYGAKRPDVPTEDAVTLVLRIDAGVPDVTRSGDRHGAC